MFSILLPYKNADSTLAEAMESIFGQTEQGFEVIAVDDHSDDNSTDVLRSYLDPRVKIYRNSGRGLVDALNHGISCADSQWIVRMDSDDIMSPMRLERMKSCIRQQPALHLVASRVALFPQENVQAGYREYIRWQNNILSAEEIANQIYVESPFAHPSVMFRKSFVEKLGGYRKGTFPEDYDLWLRMSVSSAAMLKLPETLLYWRDYPDRTSRTHMAYSRASFDRLRANYLARDSRISGDRNLAFWGAGRKTRKRSQLVIDQGIMPEVFIDIDSKKIGNSIKGIKIVDPSWLENRNPKPFVLIYVTNHGARDDIGAYLERIGYRLGADFLAVG